MSYALDEFHDLAAKLDGSPQDENIIRYLACLIAELTYLQVPQWEIDKKKRVKFVPCQNYHLIIANGSPTAIRLLTEMYDLRILFLIEDRTFIAFGIEVADRLFVGFRGTAFAYEWPTINFRGRLIPSQFPPPHAATSWRWSGRYHRGFLRKQRESHF